MLRLASLALLVAAACGAPEDDWVTRPPGGGTGGTGQTIDAAPAIDASSDGGLGLDGLVCVVADLRRPALCPPGADAVGVLVRKLGDTTGASSGIDGRFTLAITDVAVTLDVASGSTTLQRSLAPVLNTGLVHAPAPTTAAWTATVAALDVAVSPGSGAIALIVDAGSGAPAMGAIVDLPPGVVVGPFYDGGSATTWTTAGGTGPYGAALLVDVPPGTYQIDAAQAGSTMSIPDVPVVADTVTFIRGRLSP